MPVSTYDLGVAVCRALMRELRDRPVIMNLSQSVTEANPAAGQRFADQWCAVLTPTLDWVGVSTHLQSQGPFLWDQAVLDQGGDFPHSIFVPYPVDPAAIIGPGYEASLRAAVEKALTVVDASYRHARGEADGRKGHDCV